MNNKFKIVDLPGNIKYSIDLFICSSSFEERCLSIPFQISKIDYNKVFICYNANHTSNINNTKYLLDLFNKKSVEIKFNSERPLSIAENFYLALKNSLTSPKLNIILDITTFTHEALLIIIKILSLFKDRIENLYILYVGAREYSYNQKDEDKWLSKGIGNIRTVLGYSGLINPSNSNHLIILFGFEYERTSKLIDTFDSYKVSLGFGSKWESINQNHYKINYERHLKLMQYYPRCEKFEFSLTDPYSTKKILIDQISKFPNYNTIIASMNNKISTIGAALVGIKDKNIQLCYVTANQYNIECYSIPSEDYYFYTLSFNN